MSKKDARLKLVFWTSVALGAVGFLDFLSKPLITPFVEDYFGREIGAQITFLTAVYMDLKNSGMGSLGDLFFELVVFLNSLWFVFFIIAFLIYRSKKWNKVTRNQADTLVNDNHETTKLHAVINNRNLTLAGGIMAVILGLVFLSSVFSGNLVLFPLIVGGAFLLAGFALLREYFGRKNNRSDDS